MKKYLFLFLLASCANKRVDLLKYQMKLQDSLKIVNWRLEKAGEQAAIVRTIEMTQAAQEDSKKAIGLKWSIDSIEVILAKK